MIEGEDALALRNISRTARSDSPTNLFKSYVQAGVKLRMVADMLASELYLRALDSNKVNT